MWHSSSFAALILYVQSLNKKDVHHCIEDLLLNSKFSLMMLYITTTDIMNTSKLRQISWPPVKVS